MVHESTIKQYLEEGKQLILLNGKLPLEKRWPTIHSSDEKIYNCACNLGWALGEDDLVIDVDPRNGGEEGFKSLMKKLDDEQLYPTVKTPRGGFHIYLKIPKRYKGVKLRKTLQKEYPGIDFLTKGAYVVISGSATNDGNYTWIKDDWGLGGFEQLEAPEILCSILNKGTKAKVADDDDWGFGSFSDWSEDQVQKMLDKLDNNMPNDDWVKVGMALHDWDQVEGLDLWEKWSVGGDTYKEGQTQTRWDSFDLGGGVTLGTISYMAKVVDFDDQYDTTKNFIDQITNADERDIEMSICPQIRKTKLKPMNREKIAKAIQDRHKTLNGLRPSISAVRDMISDIDLARGEFLEEGDISWCDDWVYVGCLSGYFNVKKYKLAKTEQFNLINGKYIPRVAGAKQRASNFVADGSFVKTVDTVAYLPWESEVVCELDGEIMVNTFNPASIPETAVEFTEEGKQAIKKIERHIRILCGNDSDAKILTQWIVWQVQFPGRQRLWSPLIQAIEGVGKSFLGALLRACLGSRNVGTVSSTQVTSDFNGWATDCLVNILEEIKINGKNRYETINSLKPLITDEFIQINDKGIKPYMTRNTANYIAFTNHKDAIPVTIDDRRWWLISVGVNSLVEFEELVGEDLDTYFPDLFSSLKLFGDEVRKWALQYPISDDFMKLNRAPMTEYKRAMIATEDSNIEGLVETKDMIKRGGKYFNEECLSSSDLFDNVTFEYEGVEINHRMRNIILKKLGYLSVSSVVKIDGKSRRVWTKRVMSNKQIRASFKDRKLEIERVTDN